MVVVLELLQVLELKLVRRLVEVLDMEDLLGF